MLDNAGDGAEVVDVVGEASGAGEGVEAVRGDGEEREEVEDCSGATTRFIAVIGGDGLL